MEAVGPDGPVIVCLEDEHDIGPLVRCGIALARLSGVPLCLTFLVVLPKQRPLDILTQDEEQEANRTLDVAAEYAAESGFPAREDICIARSRVEAIQQIAEDLQASTVIVKWHGAGPFGLFDPGRALLKAVNCPVIMVGVGSTGRPSQASWPPSWLSESRLEHSK